ncbi:MAG TPA: maltose alpha-D-glucosyltransferase [Thermoanaerobaculia bacterium]|nr:maltose alpha-D-glucosyltransferase [Thermoanaerobaculia bacterium]
MSDDLWYKDGVIYQIHVRAFFDSADDGVGDFRGLTQKLDYLQDLGVNILWLLPFYPSPLRDDGYDIANYAAVNPAYGSLADFRTLMKEAHNRGIRVITELVINHTSDQHAWFQKSRQAKPGSAWRDFYVWSDTPDKYNDARIIFKDFETSNWAWDPVVKQYYWHRFYSHQPDLNFDNPAVHDALLKALDFWMDMGVDAFRLDAIPYLYEREGTTSENLPETHGFLKKLRKHMDEHYPGRMLLAEANQWPEDTLPYFGDGDECHMAFNFPVMPRMYMSLAMEDRFPITDIMSQTPAIPENCQWALFLRNHDELTLEMVTDEDRDYMWRTYAKESQARINLGIRRRLAPLLDNHRLRIHLMNGLLFSLPGTPIIYYGDEIGMGDNIYLGDRNGVRTPMQWSADRNAGFSRANPQRLFLPVVIDPAYHYEQVNVEAQQNNPHSLLWWMKRLIATRKRFQAFGRGTMEFLHPENRKILAFTRRWEGQTILVVANLSRLVQCFELDLQEFRGMVPVELSGGVRFPEITERPWFLNLGPFAFYWFQLQKQEAHEIKSEDVPLVNARKWEEVFADRYRDDLARALERYVRGRRWFAAKARTISYIRVRDHVQMPGDIRLAIIDVEFTEGEAQTYLLPLAITEPKRTDDHDPSSATLIARLRDGQVLYEPVSDDRFATALLDTIGRKRQLKGRKGSIAGAASRHYRELRGSEPLETHILKAEQSNTAVVYGQKLFLKLFRKLEPGMNPDLEINRFLNEETSFRNVPSIAGWLEYRDGAEPVTVGILQGYTLNSGDGWTYTLDAIGRYFERLLSEAGAIDAVPKTIPGGSIWGLAEKEIPSIARDLLGAYIADAQLLGRRTAEMHLALGSTKETGFVPESFTPHYQRSIYQSMRSQAVQAFQVLRRRAKGNEDAEEVLSREAEIHARLRAVLDKKIHATRIRVHGDYHLGQVLRTANDFTIIDFEGEPSRPLSERRIKRNALRDVAGMLRSFHYAPYAVVFGQAPGLVLRTEDRGTLESGATFWHRWVSAAFLNAYFAASHGGGHVPQDPEQARVLLDAYLLEKALYEITYELNNRPDWVAIPLRGVLELLDG